MCVYYVLFLFMSISVTKILGQQPTAKRLFLSLASARAVETLTIAQLIDFAGLFGMEPGAVRVAAARLVKQGFFKIRSRGVYAIGPEGKALSDAARAWADVEKRLREWNGGWLAVHTSHLGRSDKTALRARERAFRLRGFKALATGLWVRPDNFAEDASETKAQLTSLGLETGAVLLVVRDVHSGDTASALSNLWARTELEDQYSDCLSLMSASAAHLHDMKASAACREAFLVGEYVIRQITADPLLPDGMIDAGLRKQMIERMVKYNELGAEIIWAHLDQHR
jgi:phenylacetic acid degradation operon negative regulatory protein